MKKGSVVFDIAVDHGKMHRGHTARAGPALWVGPNMIDGNVVHSAIAAAFGIQFTDAKTLL